MHTIVSLRGTMGSGKTTVVRTMMGRWPAIKVEKVEKARSVRTLVYRLITPVGPVFIFGSYQNVCGGCDTISDYKTIIPALLRKYAPQGHLLFEGMLLSDCYGAVGEALAEQERAGHEVIFAFLDTPEEVCIKRVEGRRLAEGNTKPLNTDSLLKHYHYGQSLQLKLKKKGHRVEIIEHERAVEQVAELLGLTYEAREERSRRVQKPVCPRELASYRSGSTAPIRTARNEA